MIYIVSIFVWVLFAQACASNTSTTVESKIVEPDTATFAEESKATKPAVRKTTNFTDTFEFESYNDQGDYMLLYTKAGKEPSLFINDRNEDRSLLRGDVCEIIWSKDTIYIAGDGDTPEIADWLLKIKKVKDGAVSRFRKKYGKSLKYHYTNEGYSQEYLDHLYLSAEYYIANSKNKLIVSALKSSEQIEYSIEEREENGRHYDVLGIGRTSMERHFSIMQWIYIDVENHKIFEYDLGNEELVEFKN